MQCQLPAGNLTDYTLRIFTRACCKIGQRKKDGQGSPKRVALPAFLL